MIDDEEKQLRRELLAVELSLKRKQEFWETPRNIAILVGVTALIAGAIGFWFGRESATPPTPAARPVVLWFGEVRDPGFVDAVQTLVLVVIAGVLITVAVRLNRAVTVAAEKIQGALADMMRQQNQLQQNVRRIWERIDLIEARRDTEKPEGKINGRR
jgi:hypothetical protein